MINNSYSLLLKSQSRNRRNFRCEATNAAGSAHQDIVVVIVPSEFKKEINSIDGLNICTNQWQI